MIKSSSFDSNKQNFFTQSRAHSCDALFIVPKKKIKLRRRWRDKVRRWVMRNFILSTYYRWISKNLHRNPWQFLFILDQTQISHSWWWRRRWKLIKQLVKVWKFLFKFKQRRRIESKHLSNIIHCAIITNLLETCLKY